MLSLASWVLPWEECTWLLGENCPVFIYPLYRFDQEIDIKPLVRQALCGCWGNTGSLLMGLFSGKRWEFWRGVGELQIQTEGLICFVTQRIWGLITWVNIMKVEVWNEVKSAVQMQSNSSPESWKELWLGIESPDFDSLYLKVVVNCLASAEVWVLPLSRVIQTCSN